MSSGNFFFGDVGPLAPSSRNSRNLDQLRPEWGREHRGEWARGHRVAPPCLFSPERCYLVTFYLFNINKVYGIEAESSGLGVGRPEW
jgi:hypothetical protein